MDEKQLQKLFSQIRNGDRDAFARVYQELKQPVFAISYRIVGEKEAAEDITHDVFVKLFRSPPDASVKNTRAWIFQMARNLSIDALRKRSREAGQDEPILAEDPYPSLHSRMDLEAALRSLPQQEREILTLHLNAELGFREIAAVTGLSMSAAYRTYRKALKNVQNALNGGEL